MAAYLILFFLTGAVLAWRFRVWILIPFAIVAMTSSAAVEFWTGTGALVSIGIGLLAAIAPQLGYAFGLIARQTLASLRSPLSRHPKHRSVARLYQWHDIKENR